MNFETVAVLAVATVLQLPIILFLGIPWFLVAWVVKRLTRDLPRISRAAVLALPIAGGLAPVYGFHAAVFPAYFFLFGQASNWPWALLSFALTWVLVFFFLLEITRISPKSTPELSEF